MVRMMVSRSLLESVLPSCLHQMQQAKCARSLMGKGFPLTVLLLINNSWGVTPLSQLENARCLGRQIGRAIALPRAICEGSQHPHRSSTTATSLSLSSQSRVDSRGSLRPGKTAADEFFREHGEIPIPAVKHHVLSIPKKADDDYSKQGILIIGDIHGCYDEMIALIAKATELNGGKEFLFIVGVGDLVNKGPCSAKVIRHVRTTRNFRTVRGNHDDGALAAALGDESPRKKSKYAWVGALSDDDIQWLADLPYTIRIPTGLLDEEARQDTVIVHAGFVPGIELQQQSREAMVLIREVEKVSRGDSYKWKYSKSSGAEGTSYPWATVWTGPDRVIFGHDARRGLQLHKHAIGLDTGACYGKQLSGIIIGLPQEKLVQVDSSEVYCPI